MNHEVFNSVVHMNKVTPELILSLSQFLLENTKYQYIHAYICIKYIGISICKFSLFRKLSRRNDAFMVGCDV